MDIIEFYSGIVSFIKLTFTLAPYITVVLLLAFIYMTVSKKIFESILGIIVLHSAMFFMMLASIDLMYFN